MSFSVVTVKFSSDKNCFVSLSKIETTSQDVQVFEVDGYDSGGGKCFVSWSGELVRGDNDVDGVLLINGLFAEKLGLKDKDQVILRPYGSVPNCSSVHVEAVSTEDWEIFDRHSAAIEGKLLDQLRVVQPGKVYPIWVEKSVCIFIKIGSMKPDADCALLVNETELIVKPKVKSSSIGHQPVEEPIQRKISENLEVPYINGPYDDDLYDPRYTSTDSEKSDKDYVDSGKMMTRNTREKSPYEQFNISNHWRNLISMLGFRSNYNNGKVSVSDEDDFYYDEDDYVNKFENSLLQNGLNLVLRVQYLKYTPRESDLHSYPGESLTRRGSQSPRKNGGSSGTTTPRRMSRDSPTKTRKSSSIKSKFRVNFFPQQPSTVYVYMSDVEKQLRVNRNDVPHVFLAKLHKLSSPKEQQQEKLNNSSGRNSPRKDSNKTVEKEKSPGSLDSLSSADLGERSTNKETEQSCVVRVVVVDKRRQLCSDHFALIIKRILSEQPLLKGHVIIPDMLRRYLKLDVTSRVWLQTFKGLPVKANSFSLYPLGNIPKKLTSDMVTLAFRDWLDQVSSEDYPLVVYQGLFVKFEVFPGTFIDTQIVYTDQDPHRGCYTLLHSGALRHASLSTVTWGRGSDHAHSAVQPMLAYMSIASIDPCVHSTTLHMIGGMNPLIEEALSSIEICLGSRPLHKEVFITTPGLLNGMLLLTGPKGSGKTTLARALCRQVAEMPNLAYTTMVECKPLKGKKVDTVQKILELIFDEAAWRQPSLILLEDLDHLAGAPSGPEFEMSGEALYAARLAEVVKDLLRKDIRNMTRVAVLATSQSRASLHSVLTTSRGTHLVQEVLCIKPPDKNERLEILKKIMESKATISSKTVESLDLETCAQQTQGYVARDLENVVNRAIHAHILTQGRAVHLDKEVLLTDDDISRAIEGFTPASIRNVSLHQAGELRWADVGGLTDVKDTLVETLQWPARYPTLFANCPLRLRSGLLLYGAPGTGKTLLAGVVARECGLNFISIKGPELLSKYIGASEQAVRDTFVRAQSAKPCILFFDEFDSIAPRVSNSLELDQTPSYSASDQVLSCLQRRGHDNTGVTDRVVNQLLTQLDGVEGLDGVYVLAATSRPDLIDPALLRPGRLDKALLCQLPNEEERLKILESLSRKMRLADDVDFEFFAQHCEDYTGADFKALLYNGQLEAIHEIINSQEGADGGGGGEMGRFGMKSRLGRVNKLKSRRGGMQKLSLDERRERGRSFTAGTFAYIPSLEKGVVQVSTEMEEKLSTQVSQIRLRERRCSEHIPADDQPDSPYGGNKMILVGQKHLLAAVQKMRPSVSGEERLKYQRIYENFVQSRGGNFDMGFLEGQVMKATLA